MTNVTHKEHDELKNDSLDCNTMFDDLTKQADVDLRLKKSQQSRSKRKRTNFAMNYCLRTKAK